MKIHDQDGVARTATYIRQHLGCKASFRQVGPVRSNGRRALDSSGSGGSKGGIASMYARTLKKLQNGFRGMNVDAIGDMKRRIKRAPNCNSDEELAWHIVYGRLIELEDHDERQSA